MKSKNAFTLVELLVVISIIALLVAILLPALSKARTAAKSMACLSNQRQISIATASYAADAKDGLPYYFRQEADASKYFYWGSQLATGGTASTPNNAGTLFYGGYFTDGQAYLCPAKPEDQRNGFTKDWSFGAEIAYEYNPHYRFKTFGATVRRVNGWDAVSSIPQPSKRSMTVDMIFTENEIAHGSDDEATWNLSFADGHAANAGLGTLGSWFNNTVYSNYRKKVDFIDMLESASRGEDLSVNPLGGPWWDANRVHYSYNNNGPDFD